jgi:hypothetical protein
MDFPPPVLSMDQSHTEFLRATSSGQASSRGNGHRRELRDPRCAADVPDATFARCCDIVCFLGIWFAGHWYHSLRWSWLFSVHTMCKWRLTVLLPLCYGLWPHLLGSHTFHYPLRELLSPHPLCSGSTGCCPSGHTLGEGCHRVLMVHPSGSRDPSSSKRSPAPGTS